MRNKDTNRYLSLLLALFLVTAPAWGGPKNKKRQAKRYKTPITHPVILWSRTLSEGQDPEERKVAAFKLSQYSQTIYQDSVINIIVACMKDPDTRLKVLCAKAMGKAGNQSKTDTVRKTLIETYKNEPTIRETLVRTFIARRDSNPAVQELLIESLKKSVRYDEMLVLLSYFEQLGKGVKPDYFIEVFNKVSDDKVKRAAIKVLSEHGEGEGQVVEALATCAEKQDTTLALTCLSGLQVQAKKDNRAWQALEKTLESNDQDMLMASLDVVNVLPETPNPRITQRLIAILADFDDADILDKAVLALGVAGDHSQPVVDTLLKVINQTETEDVTKINAALVLGRQSDLFPDKPKEALDSCIKSVKSQSLKTACQLGAQELQSRRNRGLASPGK